MRPHRPRTAGLRFYSLLTMNTKLLALAAVATLATAACSQEKTAETTVTTDPATATMTETTTTTVDTAAYRNEADMMANRLAQDLQITDPTVVERVKTVYYTRGRRLNTYTTDTTGRYAALKAANDETTAALATALNDAQYNTYTSHLNDYYAGQPYTVVVVGSKPRPSLEKRVGGGSTVTKMEREEDGDKKTKFANGAKVKRDDDGSLKMKRADGTKIKIDEDGNRTVKKPLFK
jgi:hypothetical protein